MGMVLVTTILNLVDAVMTIIWVTTGRATEGNPVMAELLARHPVIFVGGKCALVALGTALLWRLRTHPLAVVGIFLAFLTYYGLLVVHLEALDLRLLSPWIGL